MGWQQKSIEWTWGKVRGRKELHLGFTPHSWVCLLLKPKEGIRQCLLLWGAVKPLPSLDNFHKEQEGVEIPLDTWTKSLCWKDARFPWGVGGKGNSFYNQKAEGSHRILTLKKAPPAHLGMTLPGGKKKSVCSNYNTSKAIQWKILHWLLSCMPIL